MRAQGELSDAMYQGPRHEGKRDWVTFREETRVLAFNDETEEGIECFIAGSGVIWIPVEARGEIEHDREML